MDFSKIKCIIWDLDNTIWNGILLEDKCVYPNKSIDLIKLTYEKGIVNSICSKNSFDSAYKKLQEIELWNYFVFVSLNYESKGQRIANQISKMHFRPENVLFIDDEIQNLKEVEYYCPGIMISQPYIIAELIRYFKSISSDSLGKERIEKYRRLEEMNIDKEKYNSNEDFLKDAAIVVEINNDCENQLYRICDLNNRSNQLNFTKRRCNQEQLWQDIMMSDDSGYISVRDKYGDYGIVGFFCVMNNRLIHFCFSCRIMNMGVEQYIYYGLNKPFIDIEGEVGSDLHDNNFEWINLLNNKRILETIGKSRLNIMLKGSCDFRRMQLYLPSNMEYEVPYVVNNKNIVYQTGIPTMAMSLLYSRDEIIQLASKTPFFSELYYQSSIFEKQFDVVFLSLISLGNLGVYKHKDKNFFLSMGLPSEPMYLQEFQCNYMKDGKYANGFENTVQQFDYLRDNFDYVNDFYIEEYFEDHLDYVVTKIKAKKIVLVLGNEERYKENKSVSGNVFSAINKIVQEHKWHGNIEVINISDFIKNDCDVVNHFNHFTSKVYYELANVFKIKIGEMEKENVWES